MLKKIGIEALLTWAYRDELPKLARLPEEQFCEMAGSSSTWAQIQQFALLGTKIDTSGSSGLPDGVHVVEHPHPDALVVAAAVAAVVEASLDMPEGFDALSDMAGMTGAERADLHQRGFAIARTGGDQLVALVVRRAILGMEPSWRDHGPVKRRTVRSPNGKDAWFRMVTAASGPGRPSHPQEVEGFDVRNHRPFRGAYRKTYLDPCPSLLAAERIEYQAWALALSLIAAQVRAAITSFDVEDACVPLWPWEGEGRREAPRIILAKKVAERSEQGSKAA